MTEMLPYRCEIHLTFVAESLSDATGTYDEMVKRLLATGGLLECGFVQQMIWEDVVPDSPLDDILKASERPMSTTHSRHPDILTLDDANLRVLVNIALHGEGRARSQAERRAVWHVDTVLIRARKLASFGIEL